MPIRLLVIFISLAISSSMSAQVQVNPTPAQAKPGEKKQVTRSAGYANNRYQQQVITFLMNPTHQKELEMTDEQKKLVKELNKKLYEGYGQIYRGYPELNDKKLNYKKRSEIYRKIQVEYSDMRKKIEEELLNQLVPNQKTVLTRLKFKQAISYYGLSATLTQSQFAKEFETTENQKRELQKIKRETEVEIQKLIQEKRKAAREKMLKLLTEKQRKRIKELQGDQKKKLPFIRL